MSKFIFLFLVLMFSKTDAVLSPYYESVVEIKAILDDPRLNETLKTAMPIEKIEKVEGGWRLSAIEAAAPVEVLVAPLPQERPGPQLFELQFRIIN